MTDIQTTVKDATRTALIKAQAAALAAETAWAASRKAMQTAEEEVWVARAALKEAQAAAQP